ncbi:MAG: transketolase [Halanaerobiales bacterium]|nr:transketolase [Halanaerobiales bacterium]
MRVEIIKMIYKAQSGHPGGALSATDIVTALYFHLMNVDTANPTYQDRDRFILSKGHACPVIYAALALKGFYPLAVLDTLRALDSKLQGHPDMNKLPGLDSTSGSLGQGLSVGVGMALVGKMEQKDYHIYVMIGDGESQEGQIWEAAMAANKYKLDNIIAFTDFNRLQVDGFVDEVMPIAPYKEKWESFNWHTQEINGHNLTEIINAVELAREVKDKPHMIIAHTVKGKGVSFMENMAVWHGRAPNAQEYELALQELGGN